MFQNHSKKYNLQIRAHLIRAVREFFDQYDFLEVETPCRIPGPIPEAHIDAEPSGNWFLHTSPELCMKRLVAAGYPNIFQICKCFRYKERGDRHLPEFTLLEWYGTGMNYFDMMDQTENLIRFAAKRLGFGDELHYRTSHTDIGSPYDRMTVQQAFIRYAPISMELALEQNRFDEIVGIEIEPQLGHKKPVFLYDYPVSTGALAKVKSDDPRYVERFELYICGMELCNAFSELTDPSEQRRRFVQELEYRKNIGKTPYPMPEKLLDALHSMPQTAGNALGLDRLVMLFTNASTIDQIVTFTPEEL